MVSAFSGSINKPQAGCGFLQVGRLIPGELILQQAGRGTEGRMKKLFALALSLTFLTFFSGASRMLPEKQAKQLLRSRRQDRPSKPGFPDEPRREYMHHLLGLERRAEEQFLEHWLNPHCKPHCDRNVVHPV
ncbi:uncharacterized protein C17orf67 homolog isoform X1 [Manis javanica]|uniref:uncharacterized protein C17orf67 homolog isoform X1 n=2 Tax=Manis javanica TaxID=9974 RepID=UPI003C6CE280